MFYSRGLTKVKNLLSMLSMRTHRPKTYRATLGSFITFPETKFLSRFRKICFFIPKNFLANRKVFETATKTKITNITSFT